MQLSSGTRLGPYRIDAAIGAGGMGEVYRATDTRLDRSVAVKVLPAEFAADAALHARFEREAKVISSLSHSNICALYDIGDAPAEHGVLHYLVMEYLEGETLESRLQKGALPTDQVLRIGIEIADALDKAHKRGIVHRDLKPGNVMLTKSGAKLLDFGLARSAETVAAADDGATVQKALTQEGTLVGTFQYMSPEQLEGRNADTRSDLFALGAILYEMLTGRRAFEGRSRASIIAAILNSDLTPISEIRPLVPPALDRVVRVCMAKDPDERWQTAHDVMLQLRWVAEGGSKAGVATPVMRRRATRETVAWIVAAIASVAAIAWAVAFFRRSPEAVSPVHFSVETPPKGSLFPFDERGLALSPDGTRLAFVASGENGRRLIFIRPMTANSSEPLAGTEDASYPFWSPDGQFIAFFANGKLKKIASAGGPPQVICDAPSGRGGTWNDEGTILFEPMITSPLFRVEAGGGTPVAVTQLKADESRHRWPAFLPDNRHFVFVSGDRDISVGSLDSKETTKLLSDGSNASFVAPDLLLFARGATLMMQRIDLRKLKMVGDAVALPFVPVSHWVPKRFAVFSATRNGVLAFLPEVSANSQLVWYDRGGRQVGTVGEPGTYRDAYLSADGARIAAVKGGDADGDIWIVDVAEGRWSRATFTPGSYGDVTWSHDGSKLSYMFVTAGIGQVFVKTLARDDAPVQLTSDHNFSAPFSFSPDDRVLISGFQMPATSWDLYAMSPDGKGEKLPLVHSPYVESRARFSPDGKWFAYDSNESGRTEVYVRRYPPTVDQWQVSANGGVSPTWSSDGRELYYVGTDNLMVVPIGGGERLMPGTPRPLFHVTPQMFASSLSTSGPLGSLICGVTPDGQRFLFRVVSDEHVAQINVVVNWQGLLKDPAAATTR